MKEINDRLFEGSIFRRVPKKDSELDCYFELAGRMVAHSVPQSGPSLNCLCPAVVATLLSGGGIENAIEEIMVEDIPLNAGTAELIAFIHEVNKGTTMKCSPYISVPAFFHILSEYLKHYLYIHCCISSNVTIVQGECFIQTLKKRKLRF